jgi:methylated-DNA-[protein]-cysteine S-methyltransferase
MAATGYALFATMLGRCGIAWSERGIVAVQLPEASDRVTLARVARSVPGAPKAEPPPEVQRAIDAIAALLCGAPDDLSSIRLDYAGVPPFHRRVYELARGIVPGRTLTYGEIAGRLGEPAAARAVGQALGRNPFTLVVPCHRVLAAGNRPGGFSANGGVTTKLRLLEIEGAQAVGTSTLAFDAPAGKP